MLNKKLQKLVYWVRAYIAHAVAIVIAPLRKSSKRAPYPAQSGVAIGTEWLTQALREQKLIQESVKVESAEVVPFDAAGMAGVMNKVKVTYSQKDAGPASFILKQSRMTVVNRRSTITDGSAREAFFYHSPSLSQSTSIPHIVHAYGRYLILMEDLTLRPNFAKVGHIFGNQCWGAPPMTQDPVETLRKVYLSSAKLHAKFWKSEEILDTKWFKSAGWYKGENRALWELGMDRGRAAWSHIQSKIQSKTVGFEFSPKLEKIITSSFAKASWANLQAHLHNPSVPWTLTHGDLHAGNMVLSGDELVFVDWSQVGPWEPTTDLAQMIISDVKPEVFKKHSHNLVRAYWEQLIQEGVSASEYLFR